MSRLFLLFLMATYLSGISQSLLYFKDTYKMSNVINPYRFQEVEDSVLTFVTNKNGVFSPAISTSDASIGTWEVTGETTQVTNTPSFLLDGTERTVTLTISDFSKITQFLSSDDGIKGTLNLSLLSLCIDFNLNNNAELNSITNPVNSAVINSYTAKSSGLIGNLDMTTFSALGGFFEVDGNSNLSMILHSASSQLFLRYYAFNCNLNGTLDLSMLSGLGGDFRVNNNSNLNVISNPTNSNVFSYYRAHSCNLQGTLNMSTLTGFSQRFEVYSNANLSDINNPVTSTNVINYLAHNTGIGVLNWDNLNGAVDYIYIYNCAFTSAESDENIVLIDNNVNVTTQLWMHQNNAALTDGSVTGFDGLTAKSNLEGEGVSVLAN